MKKDAASPPWHWWAILLLSFSGLYVAGSIILSTVLKYSMPCGSGDSCALLHYSSTSSFLGVPIALYGLIYYGLSLSSVLWVRSFSFLAKIMPYIALAALVASMMLVGRLLFELRVWCFWCYLSSLLSATLCLLWSTFKSQTSQPSMAARRIATALILALPLTLGITSYSLHRQSIEPPYNRLELVMAPLETVATTDSVVVGKVNAPETLVAFVDSRCGLCTYSLPSVLEGVRKHPRMRLILRHYSPTNDNASVNIAMALEAVGRKGRLSEYCARLRERPITSEDGFATSAFLAIGGTARIDRDARKRVLRDIEFARKLGISRIPFYIYLDERNQRTVMGAQGARMLLQ